MDTQWESLGFEFIMSPSGRRPPVRLYLYGVLNYGLYVVHLNLRGRGLLLLLIIHELNVVFGNVLVLFKDELLELVAHVALHDNFFAAVG